MRLHTLLRVAGSATAVLLMAAAAMAQPTDKRTFFKFNTPVAVPGATLPAGTYLFRIAGDQTSRDVVQVLSADGRTPYAMFFAIRDPRIDPVRDPALQFRETAETMPLAVKTWFYPGDYGGYEFLYPKEQARGLAERGGEPVLTTVAETVTPADTAEGALARVAPEGRDAALAPADAVAAAPGARDAGAAPDRAAPFVRGEIAPPSIAVPDARIARAAPAAQSARAALPGTAGSGPAIALAGLLLLLTGGLLIVRPVHT